jgi:hypothetical protein
LLDAVRLEQHWLTAMASAGGGGRLIRMPGAILVVNPRWPAGFLNFITLRGADPSRLVETVETASAILDAGGREPVLFLAPPAGPVDPLAEGLRQLGWRQTGQQVVLVRPLPIEPVPLNPEVHVREVGQAELPRWGDLLVRAYEVSPLSAAGIMGGYLDLFTDPGAGATARFYLGELEGRPVGTGLSWQQGELLGLYAGAVLPEARGNGVERATLWHRMAAGAQSGARWAYLQTEVGSPVEGLAVRRLGFQIAYTRSIWLPPA